jgi:hypothetical protein
MVAAHETSSRDRRRRRRRAPAGAGLVVPGVGAPGGALEVAEVAGQTGAVAAAEARVDADLCAAARPSGFSWIMVCGSRVV